MKEAICKLEGQEHLMRIIEQCARDACDFMSFSGMLAGSLSVYKDTEELAHVLRARQSKWLDRMVEERR